MRNVLLVLSLGLVAACAPYKQGADAESPYYDSRVTTGSNIPRKGTGAIVVDKSAVQDQLDRRSSTGAPR